MANLTRTVPHRRIAEYSVGNSRCDELKEFLPLGEVCLTKYGWWQMRTHPDGTEFSVSSSMPLGEELSLRVTDILAHLDEWLHGTLRNVVWES